MSSPEEEAREFWEKDDLVFSTNVEVLNEETLTNASGRTFTISTKKRPLTLSDGSRVIVGVLRDLTELRATERELERHRVHLQELVEARTEALQASTDELMREMRARREAQKARQEVERVLRHKQRLAEMGTLAGGVAHDFNNLLTAVLGNLSYVIAHSEKDELKMAARDAHTAALQGASLSRQLLAFSCRAAH